MNKLNRFSTSRWGLATIGVVVILALLFIPMVQVNSPTQQDTSPLTLGVGQHKVTFTIGTEVYAAGTADYTCDGVADDIQFQLALNTLPAGGGKLIVLAGTYNWTALTTVTRAIANVTIEGVGLATYFVGDGVTPVFTAGGNNWVFTNLRTDVAGIAMGVTTNWLWTNVTVNITQYTYRAPNGHAVFNDVTITTLTAPIGRAATLHVAALNSTTASRAQADYICDGTNDEVQINAALTALLPYVDSTHYGGGRVLLMEGDYKIEGQISFLAAARGNIVLEGQGYSTVLLPSGNMDSVIYIQSYRGCAVKNLRINFDDYAGTVNNAVIHNWKSDRMIIDNVWMYKPRSPAILVDGHDASCSYTRIIRCHFMTSFGTAIHARGVSYLTVSDNQFENQTAYGVVIEDDTSGNRSDHVVVANNVFEMPSGSFNAISIYGDTEMFSVVGNTCFMDGHNAISCSPSSYGTIIGNTVEGSTDATEGGIEIENGHAIVGGGDAVQKTQDVVVADNIIRNCMWGIYTRNSVGKSYPLGVTIRDNHIEGCTIGLTVRRGTGNAPLAGAVSLIGNEVRNCTTLLEIEAGISESSVIVKDTVWGTTTDVRDLIQVKNTSGGALVAGDVVSLKAVVAGNEVTSPVAVGEDQVLGMLVENIADNAWGFVMVKGKTEILKATNAVGGNIAIGDFLCTEVGNRAMKAGAGDMAFAIALEVCEAADVTIDALIIKPRKI